MLLGPADLSALDLASECLEWKLTPGERAAMPDEIESGKLKPAARQVCLGDAG
ncbi:MAG TPA: hypothetical protein VFK05_22145 [Polyangiaceae bacterium]|nr:hypothetical protein [Polyangiaceae bacterium]